MNTPMILTPSGSGVRLRGEANDLLAKSATGLEFLVAAVKRKMYADAIDFAAQWLPKRGVVWWGCLCGWQVLRAKMAAEASPALHAAVAWVIDPSESNRRIAEAAGTAAGIATPAGNIALAAFHSGDSIAPAGQPTVRPAPDLANTTVANAIKLLTAGVAANQKSIVQQQFSRLALALADGQIGWPANAAPRIAPEPAAHARVDAVHGVAALRGETRSAGSQTMRVDPIKESKSNEDKDIWDSLSQME